MPTLKPKVPKELDSNIVHEYMCSRCLSTYVSKTVRHLKVRVQEHRNKRQMSIRKHSENCNKEDITPDNFKILYKTHRNNYYLMTLEALFIRERKPNLNTKDEFRDKDLRLNLFDATDRKKICPRYARANTSTIV